MSLATALAALAGVLMALAVLDGSLMLARAWARRRSELIAPGLPSRLRVIRRGSLPGPGSAPRALGLGGAGAPAALLARHGVRVPAGLRERLAAAGVSGAGGAERVMALKCVLTAGSAIAVIPPALDGGGTAAVALLTVVPCTAFLVPDALIARRARRRARLLRAQAPELLDRVRLAAEAGLDPERALTLAASRGGGLLAAEIRAALAATRLGRTREQALDVLCARCPVPEVSALAAALRRSARHGAPLAAAAAALAETSRAERARRVHDRSQRAAPKIQLVVALLLVPAALLLVAAGMLTGLR